MQAITGLYREYHTYHIKDSTLSRRPHRRRDLSGFFWSLGTQRKSIISSYETTWADQWDPSPALGGSPARSGPKGGGGGSTTAAKYGKKVEKGLVKTKDVAVVGMKKVKNGASVGFSWIKDKYHKTTNKH
ncbi:hypothetical protein Dimus_023864 [Dionaea muscipula]